MRAVPAVGDDFLTVASAAGLVSVEHGADLGDHRLGRVDVRARPSWDHIELAEVAEVEERGVGDDRIVFTADPEDGRARLHPRNVFEVAVPGRDGVVHTPLAGGYARP